MISLSVASRRRPAARHLPSQRRVTQNGRSSDSHEDADANLRALVLAYLDDHPTAMDTIDGIAEWWILRQNIDIEVRRVSRVLAGLVTEGVLEELTQSGVRFYRRRAAVARPHSVGWPGTSK
ncbi:MAG TPA: hypothetical protein VGQ52_18405 [Gemmatimonadaceae bacterium]|nr:hypothetical protein [Gemmatimonadaceae bacterium]